MNELNEKFAAEGLTVLGVTSEGKGDTEKWVAAKGAKYPYAYDAGGKLSRACGVSAIPHSVLIDATGRVIYDGSPGGITPDIVQKAVAGALKTPLYELPKEFTKVRGHIAKGDLGAAMKEAQTLKAQANAPAEAATVVDAIQGMINGQIAGGDADAQAGDYLNAQRAYERVMKSAKGLPEADTAKSKLSEMMKDDTAKKVIKAQKDLEKLLAEPMRSKKDATERKAALESFLKKNAENAAGRKAKEELDKIEKALSGGR